MAAYRAFQWHRRRGWSANGPLEDLPTGSLAYTGCKLKMRSRLYFGCTAHVGKRGDLLRMSIIPLCGGLLSIAISGCVTPSGIKELSTKHAQNLVAVESAVGSYRQQVDSYYSDLIELQRQAFVAQRVAAEIDAAAIKRDESLRNKSTAPNAPDFIESGIDLKEMYGMAAGEYDIWVGGRSEGDTLRRKATWFQEEIDRLKNDDEKRALVTRYGQYKKIYDIHAGCAEQGTGGPDCAQNDLSYVDVALELRRQRRNLIAELEVLAAQVNLMKAFHGKVDEFLGINATIDAKKIAEAAGAGLSFGEKLNARLADRATTAGANGNPELKRIFTTAAERFTGIPVTLFQGGTQ